MPFALKTSRCRTSLDLAQTGAIPKSVKSRFIDACPGIQVTKCICHSLHLCASEACKSLPRHVEDLAREIFTFFKNTAIFKGYQPFLDLDVHKMLHPSQTRWLSLHPVVARILEQWDALRLFFKKNSVGRSHTDVS